MTRLVVDASVALAWCFADETAPYAESVLRAIPGRRIVVPAHWSLEVANGLLMAERRGRTTPAETSRAIQLLLGLPIDVDSRTSDRAMGPAIDLARTHRLTSYGATYLELCAREGLPLASADAELRGACQSAGILLFAGAA